ncbi:MAG: hypothetical protein ACFFDF_06715 [Candidatus Odinarchaeota archaeon]
MEKVRQKIEIFDNRSINVRESIDLKEIKEALEANFSISDNILKPNMVEHHIKYLDSKFRKSENNIRVFIAYSGEEPRGYVVSDLNPEYKSYGRKCGTFGWLYGKDSKIIKELLIHCEEFVKENKLRRIRGPINFPKNETGFGLQINGFEHDPLYGVALRNPNVGLYECLLNLRYEAEAEYTCLQVIEEVWTKGNSLNKSLKLCCVSFKELMERLDEIIELTRDSFVTLLPDTSGGGRDNILELLHLATSIPKTHFRYEKNPEVYVKYKNIPEFIEAWQESDLENMVTMFPMVVERNTNKLIGMLIGVLDHYQYWKDEYVSRVNVHTAMVRKGYNGKGVFSSLNNFGQATNRCMMGTTYFEGTGVWTRNSKGVNNEKAVRSIFPHCIPIRTHVVFEKKLK